MARTHFTAHAAHQMCTTPSMRPQKIGSLTSICYQMISVKCWIFDLLMRAVCISCRPSLMGSVNGTIAGKDDSTQAFHTSHTTFLLLTLWRRQVSELTFFLRGLLHSYCSSDLYQIYFSSQLSGAKNRTDGSSDTANFTKFSKCKSRIFAKKKPHTLVSHC